MTDLDHEQVRVRVGDWAAEVDRGLADDIVALWTAGIPTWSSCQGGQAYDQDELNVYIQPRFVLLRTTDPVLVARAFELLPWAEVVETRLLQQCGLPNDTIISSAKRMVKK